jgi:hypothetical protein
LFITTFSDFPQFGRGGACTARSAPLPTLRPVVYHVGADHGLMLFKIIAFLAALVPLVLFLRAIFIRRPSRMREGLKEFKTQVDLAVWIFLGLIGCVVVFAAGRLAWAWWTSL